MKPKNTYYLLRHGQALSNVRHVYSSWPETFKNPLTKKGVAQVKRAARKLSGKEISVIFSSDLLRAKQTAQIVARALKLNVKFDTRLREASLGKYNGKPTSNFYYTQLREEKPGYETYSNIAKRLNAFLASVEKKYHGRHVLVVSHQCPLWVLENIIRGISFAGAMQLAKTRKRLGKAQIRVL